MASKKHHNFKTYVSLILVSSIISGSLVGGGLYLGFSNQLKKQNDAIEKLSAISTIGNSSVTTSAAVKKADYTGQSTVTKIAKEVGPSIVGIRMTVNSNQRSFYNSGMSEAEGSGIIISKDGYIMTNYHVVQYADPKASTSANTTLEVFLSDKTQAKAKFIGGDSETDLAVIKVDLNNLPVATLGDSSTLEVGELAVAIGNPLGMEFAGSVTTGVVSALNRTIQSADITQSLIQTDAAINPGNSGGALLDSNGEVIGINSAKISETGVEGLGFAIPINDAKPIINQLMMFGYVKGRPFIGISGQDVTDTISKTYNLPIGIYITQVSQGSGAAAAGIKTGDVLTAVNGKAVATMDELNTVKKQYKPGDTVTITVVRNGKTLSIKLTFSEQR
jgi:serine protease Do